VTMRATGRRDDQATRSLRRSTRCRISQLCRPRTREPCDITTAVRARATLGVLLRYTQAVAAGRGEVPVAHAVRSAPAWLGSLKAGRDPLVDRKPWMTYRSIQFLEQYLQPGMSVFEYGSGGSTAFFLDHGCQLITVEHDDSWAAAVQDRVGDHAQWTTHFVRPDGVDENGSPADPYTYVSGNGHLVFKEYVETIDAYDAFDLVSVDGRARPAALRHSISKVRPGGVLLLDNSEREEYARGAALVDAQGWRRKDLPGPGPYNDYFWRTTVWIRC
jgi:hypothetical protein